MSVARGLGKHGIIKVACGFAINGDERQLAQIHTALNILFPHTSGQLGRQCFRRRRELVRQFVFAQRNFHFHTGVSVIAQHLYHTSDGL